MMICFYLANIADMRDFYIYWYYSAFYMLTFSYRAYMGFIGYLCTYTPNREGKRERRGTQKKQGKNTNRKERGAEERSIK